MSHLLSASSAAPDVASAPSAVGSVHNASTPVLITEQQVVFSTAAAMSVPPTTTRNRRLPTRLSVAIGRVHLRLPEPRPIYPRRESNYFEAARMSREMDRL